LLQPLKSALLERKDHLPILLHVDHGPPVNGSGPQSDVETTEMRLPIVGIFAFGIGVVNDGAEAYDSRRLCKFGRFVLPFKRHTLLAGNISVRAHILAVSA
jgi:hypothetical protein